MAASAVLRLDTTPPQGVTFVVDGDAQYAISRDVVGSFGHSDPGGTTGWQVKIYGDVDDAFAPTEYRALEANAPWVSWAATKNIRLSAGDGLKTVRVKVKDAVDNSTAEITDTITLDLTAPVPNLTQVWTPGTISKQTGKRRSQGVWSVPEAIQAYKVKVVPSENSVHTAGNQILTTNGSTNVSGGAVAANTPITTEIDGADLEAVGLEGDNIVKVFVRDPAGNWSVAS